MQTSPFALLPALVRVLNSLEAARNGRALYALLAGFCVSGTLLAMAQSALARGDEVFALVWGLFALASAFISVNTTGLLLMDQARGLPVRDPADALIDSLRSCHRSLAVLGVVLLGLAAGAAALTGLLWATRWPGIGPLLLGLTLPLGVISLGAAALALVGVVGPLTGPAVWAGLRTRGVLAFLAARLGAGLVETALLMAAVYLVTALVTAVVGFVVVTGSQLLAGLAIGGAGIELPARQLLAGVFGLGPRALGAAGAPLAGGSLGLAALIGGGVVFALALVLPTLVYLRGCCAVYLALAPEAGGADR